MKKIIISVLSVVALFVSSDLFAQEPPAYPLYFADTPDAPAAMMPYTTVKVYLTVEKETVRTGPYARYAQKYLGVMAPLADRMVCRIIGAQLDYTDPDRKIQSAPQQVETELKIVSHVDGGELFTRAQPDRVTNFDKPIEEMARDAANTIFNLRRQRLEILTGDAAELYMGGLEAALAEMLRLENEYLALFLGKQTIEVTTTEIDVVPQSGRTNYIVCRFSEGGGVLPDSDLSGQPVVLTIFPENGVRATVPVKGDKRQMQTYRIADFTECKLTLGSRELAKRRIPIYQFGVNVSAPTDGARR